MAERLRGRGLEVATLRDALLGGVKPMLIALIAAVAILLVTLLWGWTFVWMKQAVLASERTLGPAGLTAGVGLFMTLRFGLAGRSASRGSADPPASR